MPRVTDKTLKPREYVFKGVQPEHQAILRCRIKELCEREKMEREAQREKDAARLSEIAQRQQTASTSVLQSSNLDSDGDNPIYQYPVEETPVLIELREEYAILKEMRDALYAKLRDLKAYDAATSASDSVAGDIGPVVAGNDTILADDADSEAPVSPRSFTQPSALGYPEYNDPPQHPHDPSLHSEEDQSTATSAVAAKTVPDKRSSAP